MDYEKSIGKRVHKGWSGKTFKSGQHINTVKGIIDHPELHIPAYTFEDDNSYVECRRCHEVEPYFECLTEGLSELCDIISDREKQSKVIMFYRFIMMMGELSFNEVFKMYFMEKEEFDHAWYDFHKSMRQTDFYDMGENSGHADMLFWNFIHLTDVPYKLMKTFTEKIKVGIISEFDDDEMVDGTGWNKFGLFRALRNERATAKD